MCQLKLPFSLLLSSQRCVLPQREAWFIHLFIFQSNTWNQSEQIKNNILNFRDGKTQFDSSSFMLYEETLSLFITHLYFICRIKIFRYSLFRLIRRHRLLIKLLTVWSKVFLRFLAPFWWAHVKNSFQGFFPSNHVAGFVSWGNQITTVTAERTSKHLRWFLSVRTAAGSRVHKPHRRVLTDTTSGSGPLDGSQSQPEGSWDQEEKTFLACEICESVTS